MNFKLIITSVLGLVIAVLLIVAWFFRSSPNAQVPDSQASPSGSFPASTQTQAYQTDQTATTSTVVPPGAIEVASQGGGIILTNDFLNNGITLADPSNKGQFLLAGDFGHCIDDPKRCQAGVAKDFNIYYFSDTKSFGIALLDEPLGEVRSRMEQLLLRDLGISQQEMCRLKYFVTTTSYVNEKYSGRNLGFSFCPGATPLPQ